MAKFGKKTDMKRAAQPEELSPAYVFLASPCCSSYITGIVLPVTGQRRRGVTRAAPHGADQLGAAFQRLSAR